MISRWCCARGCPDVQESVHEASHIIFVSLRSNTKIEDHELRLQSRVLECNTFTGLDRSSDTPPHRAAKLASSGQRDGGTRVEVPRDSDW